MQKIDKSLYDVVLGLGRLRVPDPEFLGIQKNKIR